MVYLNKKQAVERMVLEFNSIKTSLIEKAFPYGEGLEEITPCIVEVGDKVDYRGGYDLLEDECLEVVEVKDGGIVVLKLNNKRDVELYGDTIETEFSMVDSDERLGFGFLPMWGWMWTVDSCTEHFIRENLVKVAELGFRIYEDEDGGLYIGIDGAGYDFYEAHWEPLYDAMGLRWHTTA